jgi:hypothetical protein
VEFTFSFTDTTTAYARLSPLNLFDQSGLRKLFTTKEESAKFTKLKDRKIIF